MSSEPDYAKYRNRLRQVSDLVDQALSGRLKYHPQTLKPLPFEGISVVHRIGGEQARDLQLSQITGRLKDDLKREGLESKVAFVSLDSFHVTTFDLINEPDHSELLEDYGLCYRDVREAVEQAAVTFIKGNAKLSETATIEAIGMFAPSVIKLNVHLEDQAKEKFKTFRRKLNKHLIENVTGYCLVRGKSQYRELSAHITLGYIVNPMTEEEIDAFLEVLRNSNQAFASIPFQLTQGEVTQFTDMDHFSEVE